MNQRLPSVTAREAIRALERAGFVVSHAHLAVIADLFMLAVQCAR